MELYCEGRPPHPPIHPPGQGEPVHPVVHRCHKLKVKNEHNCVGGVSAAGRGWHATGGRRGEGEEAADEITLSFKELPHRSWGSLVQVYFRESQGAHVVQHAATGKTCVLQVDLRHNIR